MTNYEAVIARIHKLVNEAQLLLLRAGQMREEVERLKQEALDMPIDFAMEECQDMASLHLGDCEFPRLIKGGKG